MGWFERKPKYDACSFYISSDNLPKLLVELYQSWDFNMSQITSMIYGLPIHISWVTEKDKYLVWLGPAYVESLSNSIPIFSIEERYGDVHSARS